MIDRWFRAHPRTVGEGYVQHAGVALGFGVRLLGAGLAAIVHAAVPALFERTAGDTVRALHARMSRRHAPPAAAPGEWRLEYEI